MPGRILVIDDEAQITRVLRVAKARDVSQQQIDRLTAGHIEHRQLGFLGEPRVNVLKLNLALDQLQ